MLSGNMSSTARRTGIALLVLFFNAIGSDGFAGQIHSPSGRISVAPSLLLRPSHSRGPAASRFRIVRPSCILGSSSPPSALDARGNSSESESPLMQPQPPASIPASFWAAVKLGYYWYVLCPLRDRFGARGARKALALIAGALSTGTAAAAPSAVQQWSLPLLAQGSALFAGAYVMIGAVTVWAWRHFRQTAFPEAYDVLSERISSGRAVRAPGYDLFYPPGVNDGSSDEGEGRRRIDHALLFYPGLLVDRTSHAPIMAKLSDAGILVAVANVEPLRVPTEFTGVDADHARQIMADVEASLGGKGTVGEWCIGGHSLGAHCASELVRHLVLAGVERVVLWGSMWSRNLRDIVDGVDVLVVNGSNDGLLKRMCDEKSFRAMLPGARGDHIQRGESEGGESGGSARLHLIEGANHAGFGHYGPQVFPAKDDERTIPLDEQQRLCVEYTLSFILGQK